MKVIGLTDGMRGEAERQCAAGFRAWIAEAEASTWGSWKELQKHYPRAFQTIGDEAHFPLTTDGTGVRAHVFFKQGLLVLGGIAPPPPIFRTTGHHQSLPTQTTQKTSASTL